MTRPAASCETCSSWLMDGRQPDGLLDAKVALTTRTTTTTVMYHLRARDQFFGSADGLLDIEVHPLRRLRLLADLLSISSGEKSRCPSLLRNGGALSLMPFDRYGFATGLDIILSNLSISFSHLEK